MLISSQSFSIFLNQYTIYVCLEEIYIASFFYITYSNQLTAEQNLSIYNSSAALTNGIYDYKTIRGDSMDC